ncbi:MAG: hypothetical protein HOC23_14605 [Halieaceae bacterium]|jgi:hypothetical protein|nr:hypothetical protein [Halieaceae bacterium]
MDLSKMKELVGQESSSTTLRHNISISDVRHWCEVIKEDDRNYKEFGDSVTTAPNAMLMAWTMPPLWSAQPRPPTEPHELVIEELESAGYKVGLGIALEQKFLLPVNIGDRLSYTVTLAGLSSAEVETSLGAGYRIDLDYTFTNQDGNVVSQQKYTVAQMKSIQLQH